MTLVKTSILSFIATAIKMLAGLVINKTEQETKKVAHV